MRSAVILRWLRNTLWDTVTLPVESALRYFAATADAIVSAHALGALDAGNDGSGVPNFAFRPKKLVSTSGRVDVPSKNSIRGITTILVSGPLAPYSHVNVFPDMANEF